MKMKTECRLECAEQPPTLSAARKGTAWPLALCAILLAFQVRAEESYFSLPLSSLEFTKGTLPKRATDYVDPQLAASSAAYGVLKGDGEIFVQQQITQPWDQTPRLTEDKI